MSCACTRHVVRGREHAAVDRVDRAIEVEHQPVVKRDDLAPRRHGLDRVVHVLRTQQRLRSLRMRCRAIASSVRSFGHLPPLKLKPPIWLLRKEFCDFSEEIVLSKSAHCARIIVSYCVTRSSICAT